MEVEFAPRVVATELPIEAEVIPQRAVAPMVPPAPRSAVPAQSESDALFTSIMRIAQDQTVDIDRLTKLLELHERFDLRARKQAFYSAFADMQPNLPIVAKKGEIKTNEKDERGNKTGKQIGQSKYALWEDIVEASSPVLGEFGFSLSFRISQTPDRVIVKGVLAHCRGYEVDTEMSLPIDSTGSKNNVQGWGSSVSYGKRYVAGALLNIAAKGEDRDGDTPPPQVATITEEQQIKIREWIEATQTDTAVFCEHFKVANVAAIKAADYDRVIEAFKRKQAQKGSR